MGRIGMPEVILILAVFLLLFGSTKLPEVGEAIGKAIRQFKKGLKESDNDNPSVSDQTKK